MFSASNLAIIAIILSSSCLWQLSTLRKHLRTEDQIASPKWLKAAHGSRYIVEPCDDKYPEGTEPTQAAFFQDSAIVVKTLNQWNSHSAWSFEDDGRLTLEPPTGAARKIVIRHGQQKTGWLQLTSMDYKSDGAFREMFTDMTRANLEIINARFWSFRDLRHIAASIAGIIEGSGHMDEARLQAMTRALECVWNTGPDSDGNPSFELSFEGKGLAEVRMRQSA